MQFLKNSFRILKYNIKTLLEFEFLYKIISISIFTPIAILLFNKTLDISGFSYLTYNNIFYYLKSPWVILILLFLLIYLTIIVMFEITTLILIYDASYQKIKVSMIVVLKLAFSKCKNYFKFSNIVIPFFVLFLIPLLNVGMGSSIISSLNIPDFILDYIYKNSILFVLFIAVMIWLFYLLLRWMYSFHYMVLEDKNFKEARQMSKTLSKKRHTADTLYMILLQILVFLFYFVLLLLGIFLIGFIQTKLQDHQIIESLTITIIWLFMAFLIFTFFMLSNALTYAGISALYYKRKRDQKEKIIPYSFNTNMKKKNKKKLRIILWVLGVILFILSSIYTYNVITKKATLNIDYDRNVEITAHRGASAYYPENTMSAFVGAKDLGADWIELDVQQTKDEKIIVMHDTNFKRTTGVNKKTIETTYDEVKELDAGSSFSAEYKDERIPLLDDVIKWAKENDIRLNIELKPTGKEVDFEKSVLNIINKNDFKEKCIVTSMDYKVLEKIKEIDSSFTTFYVMGLAVGDLLQFDKADGFSLEASNITRNRVEILHSNNKKVLAWTINSEDKMRKMIDFGVDNIITDNIILAKKVLENSKTSSVIEEYLEFLENLFE